MGLDVEVGVKDAKFKSGLAQIRSQVKQFSGSITGMLAGAFSIAGITAFASKMREVQKDAQRFGTSTESIQRIGKIARENSVDFDVLARSMNKVTLEATRAARGGAEQSKAFKTLGIDAAKFVSLPLDKKILVLSDAFQRSRGSGMATAAMLELLGNRGSEIIPLIAQGPAALSAGMKDATVQTDSTVAAFARLDKQIQKIKGTASKMLGGVIGGFQRGAAGLSSLFNTDLQDAAEADMQSEQSRRKAAGQQPMGFLERRKFVVDRLQQLRTESTDAAMKDAQKADDEKPAPVAANDFTNEDDTKKKASLLKEIEEETNRNRAESLTGEARINELMAQRAALADKINDETVEGLEAKKESLSLDHQIEQAQKELNKAIEGAEKSEEKVLEQRYLEKATPAQKKAFLQDKQKRLMGESTSAEKDGDFVKAIEKRTEAESVQGEIDQADKEKGKGKKVTVAVDSLQRVGGGGGIGPAADPALKQLETQTQLLRQIHAALLRPSVEVRDVPPSDY